MSQVTEISVRLAEALLLKNGEISLPEIRALPMVDDEIQVLFIADSLIKKFEVSRSERPSGAHSSNSEETLRLIGAYRFGNL